MLQNAMPGSYQWIYLRYIVQGPFPLYAHIYCASI